MGMSIKPSDFSGDIPRTITEYLDRGIVPPKQTATEMHTLDIHCVEGISSVKEALTTWSALQEVGYRDLTRYATLIAYRRLRSLDVVKLLADEWVDYRRLAKAQKQPVRLANNRPLEALSNSYHPLVRDSYHIWCWDEDNKRDLFGVLKGINMGVRLINPFIALVLSELPELEELSNDLLEEYQQGLQHLNLMVMNLTFFINHFTLKNGIW